MDQNQNQFENLYQQPSAPVEKNASYYRTRAREALKGKWGEGIVISLLYSLLGGGVAGGVSGSFSSSSSSVNVEIGTGAPVQIPTAVIGVILAIASVVAIGVLVYTFFVASPIMVGYMKANLDFVDGKTPQISSLFAYFKINYLKTVGLYALYTLIMAAPVIIACVLAVGVVLICASVYMIGMSKEVVMALAVILSLILVIAAAAVSIVLSYSYRYCFTILAEYPHLKPGEALQMSRNLMKGNKWKLFCLDFSFIGWELLAVCCTCGLGMVVLMPYQQVASAAFYHDVSKRSNANEAEFPSLNPDDYVSDGEGGEKPINPDATMGEGMPFTSELKFPSLNLDDYMPNVDEKSENGEDKNG